MEKNSFVDYYEVLQINRNADFETIERVFRLLAKKFHPDNQQTGNADKFNLLYEAYQQLSHPEKRAAYDSINEQARASRWKILDEASQLDGFDTNDKIRHAVLSLLYVARKRDALNPGLGIMELEKLLHCTQQVMEFQIWYLKEKGWILRTENGEYAITANGVDKVEEEEHALVLEKGRLLPEYTEFSEMMKQNLKSAVTCNQI
jgi:hypothetical protein